MNTDTSPSRRTTTETETETETETSTTDANGSTATIAKLALPGEEFALGETLVALDGVAFEIERVAAHGEDCLMPYVWADSTGGDADSERDALERALSVDSTVANFDGFAIEGEEWLYRIEWSDRIEGLICRLVEEGTVLAATGQDGTWHLRVLFPERKALARTYETCTDEGLTVEIKRIYQVENGHDRHGQFGLTDKQQRTLAAAFEHGYYGVPRTITAEELADKVGISHQALSEQFRRAHETLVENAVVFRD